MTVERGEHLAALDALLTGAATGRGRVALITGPPGCGRTELLETFADRVRDAGATLLAAAGSRDERDVPWSLAGQLADGLAAPDPAAPDAVVAHRAGLALLARAGERPLVICVDDVAFADRQSLLVLLTVLRRVRGHRVLAVLTAGTHHGPGGWTELLRVPRLASLHLEPLSAEGVAAVLAESRGAPGPAAAAAWHAVTGGNPLLLRGLLADTQAGAGDGPPPAGWAFRHALLACLDRGEPMLTATAQAYAVLGAGGGDAARLLDADPAETGHRRDILTAAGLLGADGFRHPEARQIVLDTLDDENRIRLHRRAAEQTRDAGADRRTVAGHLAAAGRLPFDWAHAVLAAAAEQALAEDRPDEAVRFVRAALDQTDDQPGDPRRTASLTALLARARWRRNPASALRHLDPLCRAAGLLGPPETVQLLRYLTWHGRNEEAAGVLAGVLPAAEDGPWLGELRAVYRYLHHGLAPLDRLLPGAASRSEPVGAEGALAGLVLDDHTVELAADRLAALARSGHTERALARCDDLLAQAARRGAHTSLAQLTAVRAELALASGDLPGAVDTARRALDLLSPAAWGVVAGSPLAVAVLALTRLGRAGEADDLVRTRLPEAAFPTRFGAQFLYARGHHHLASGGAAAAHDDFERCGAVLVVLGPGDAAPVPWRAGLALACLALGRREKAHELATRQLRDLDGGVAGGETLRVLAAASELRRRPALLREAVDNLQAGPDRAAAVAALADLSDAYHQLGEFDRARLTARQARDRAAAIGAEPLCAHLLPADTSAPGAARGADTDPDVGVLSKAEWRVASLAALGHTNTEISRKLFITVSTVEQHLTRVYRKLKVARRGDLPTILHPAEAVA